MKRQLENFVFKSISRQNTTVLVYQSGISAKKLFPFINQDTKVTEKS